MEYTDPRHERGLTMISGAAVKIGESETARRKRAGTSQ
jgi:hypothetical protein